MLSKIEGSPSLPQKRRFVPLPNIAVEESAENRAVASLRPPPADRPGSLRIECESTRFRAAHDAALREIRVAHRRPSTQVCCLAWRHSQISLLQLRYLPDLVHFQAHLLSLPTIERLSADSGLPDHLCRRNTHLCLHQHSNHLFHAASAISPPSQARFWPKTNIQNGSGITGRSAAKATSWWGQVKELRSNRLRGCTTYLSQRAAQSYAS